MKSTESSCNISDPVLQLQVICLPVLSPGYMALPSPVTFTMVMKRQKELNVLLKTQKEHLASPFILMERVFATAFTHLAHAGIVQHKSSIYSVPKQN